MKNKEKNVNCFVVFGYVIVNVKILMLRLIVCFIV